MDPLRDEQSTLVTPSDNASASPKLATKPRKSKIGPQVLASVSGMLAVISFGFHCGWPAPALVKLLAEDSEIPVTPSQSAWIVGLFAIGCVCTSICVPLLMEKWGRKTILLQAAVPCLAGNIIIIFATNYQWIYLARFVIGIGVGLTLSSATVYVSEVVEDRFRGTVGALFNIALSLGLVIAYCVGPWVDRKTLAGVGAAIPVVFALAFFWMPESPYYLNMKKKYGKDRKSLAWLRGTPDVSEELDKIAQDIEFDKKNTGSYRDVFMVPENRRALLIATGLAAAQEFTGIGAINAYSSLVFEAAGVKLGTNISLIIIALIQFLSGCSASFTANLAGRRQLLLISVIGSVTFLSCEALYFQLKTAGIDVTSIFWLPLTAIVGFIPFYTLGLGVLPPSIFMELFRYNVKAKGFMITAICGYLSLTFVTQIHQILATFYGVQYAFWFFAASTVCSGIFIYFLLPETRNRSYREIQNHLSFITRSKSTRIATNLPSYNPSPL